MNNMMQLKNAPGIVLLLCMAVGCWADEVADAVRKISAAHHEAVVLVDVVIEMYDSERKYEGLATVVDPGGLAVMSLSSIDPASTSTYLSGQDAKVKDVKIVTQDGKEIPAKVVLRDQDLDLAFIRPLEKPSETFPYVDIRDNAEPAIMDRVVVLSRLGSIAGNVPMVTEARVLAIIEKPRTVYMPEPFAGLVCGMGTPVFSIEGKFTGLLLLRISRSADAGFGEMSGGIAGLGMLPVVLPAEEIIQVIQKAPELK